MSLRADDRAVTVQIGAVLLFGILIISMATYQVTVVPDDNAAVEFRQSQETQKQMQSLRNAIVRSAASGARKPASVTLGTTYPSRALFINPPPATGTLRTAATGDPAVNLTIAGAVAGDEEVRDYWNGSTHTFDTGFLVYEPDFNEYRNAPTTIYEHTVIANAFDNGRTLSLSGQSLIDGRRVNLVALNGSMRETGVDSTTVAVRPLSASANTIAVRNETSPIVISFATRLTNQTWRRLLATENVSAGGHVTDVDFEQPAGVDYTIVHVSLESGVTYELDAALVGVGAVRDSSPPARYLAAVDGFDKVQNGSSSTGSVTVQVRDAFNNPVSNVTVRAHPDDNITITSPNPAISDEQGLVTFEYQGRNVTTNATLNVTIDDGAQATERVVFTNGTVTQAGTSTFDTFSGAVRVEDERVPSKDVVVITLNNTKSRDVNITEARIVFYAEQDPNPYDYANASKSGSGTVSANLTLGGDYVKFDPQITVLAESTVDVKFVFEPQKNADFSKGEYFILTVVYSNGEVDTYFIPVG